MMDVAAAIDQAAQRGNRWDEWTAQHKASNASGEVIVFGDATTYQPPSAV